MSFDLGIGIRLGLALALGAGCAHRAPEGARVDDLNRTINGLKAQNTAYQKQIEELENRVFILSDQLDSRKVNSERGAAPSLPRELPTVTLRPSEKAPAPPDETAAETGEAEVEFVGDAAKRGGKNPVLRLYGDETPVLTNVGVREREEPRPIAVGGEAAPRPERPSGAGRVAVSTALELYRRALDALRSGRHADAIADFRSFLRQHPAHDFADNAQYWLGECHYDQKDYAAAVREFRRVVDRYPNGNKVPDALLKAGFAHLALGETAPARKTFEELVRAYPRHEATGLATARLAELGSGSTPASRPARSSEEAP